MVSHTPALKNLAARWLELSMGEFGNTDLRIPTRKEIELRHLAKYTRQTSILERKDDGTISYRVACTLLEDAVVRDPADQNVGRFYTDEASARLERWLHALLDARAGAYYKAAVDLVSGGSATLEMLALPLNDDDGTPRFMITSNHLEYGNNADEGHGIKPIDLKGLMFAENVDLGWGTPEFSLEDSAT